MRRRRHERAQAGRVARHVLLRAPHARHLPAHAAPSPRSPARPAGLPHMLRHELCVPQSRAESREHVLCVPRAPFPGRVAGAQTRGRRAATARRGCEGPRGVPRAARLLRRRAPHRAAPRQRHESGPPQRPGTPRHHSRMGSWPVGRAAPAASARAQRSGRVAAACGAQQRMACRVPARQPRRGRLLRVLSRDAHEPVRRMPHADQPASPPHPASRPARNHGPRAHAQRHGAGGIGPGAGPRTPPAGPATPRPAARPTPHRTRAAAKRATREGATPQRSARSGAAPVQARAAGGCMRGRRAARCRARACCVRRGRGCWGRAGGAAHVRGGPRVVAGASTGGWTLVRGPSCACVWGKGGAPRRPARRARSPPPHPPSRRRAPGTGPGVEGGWMGSGRDEGAGTAQRPGQAARRALRRAAPRHACAAACAAGRPEGGRIWRAGPSDGTGETRTRQRVAARCAGAGRSATGCVAAPRRAAGDRAGAARHDAGRPQERRKSAVAPPSLAPRAHAVVTGPSGAPARGRTAVRAASRMASASRPAHDTHAAHASATPNRAALTSAHPPPHTSRPATPCTPPARVKQPSARCLRAGCV